MWKSLEGIALRIVPEVDTVAVARFIGMIQRRQRLEE
jgi:hypothetical protein